MRLGKQKQRQITKRFYSKQWYSSVEYMKNKQNEVSQDGWKGEQNNIAQRLYRKRQEKKHTEDNKAHRKHRNSEGNGYALKRGKWQAGTLVNALRVAEVRSSLHTGQYMLAVFLRLYWEIAISLSEFLVFTSAYCTGGTTLRWQFT